MDEIDEDARYPPKSYSMNRQKVPLYSRPIKARYQYEEDDEDDVIDDYVDDDNEEDAYNMEFHNPKGYLPNFRESWNFDRYPKRQRLRNAVSNYQFAPRGAQLSHDWTEDEAFVLLEVWGERFLQLGRKSLRSEDWLDVSEKVTDALKMGKTEVQCRKMMDLLKRKYKKEKIKFN